MILCKSLPILRHQVKCKYIYKYCDSGNVECITCDRFFDVHQDITGAYNKAVNA